jgi:hypothetical protein
VRKMKQISDEKIEKLRKFIDGGAKISVDGYIEPKPRPVSMSYEKHITTISEKPIRNIMLSNGIQITIFSDKEFIPN